jgi:O-antigen/teichoic acid export membrane protein
MGVVRRQSIKHNIVNLTGLAIGGISVFFLYPFVRSEYGLMQLLLQVGVIGLPLMALGGNTVAFRFFPEFKDKNSGNHGFIGLLVLMSLAGSVLLWGSAFIFRKPILGFLGKNTPVLEQYLWLAIPLSVFYVISVVLSQYSANYNRIVVPSILIDFSQKLALPLILGAIWLQWITLDTALWLLLLHGALVMCGMILYLKWVLHAWHWNIDWAFLNRARRREMLRFIFFGAFGGLALQLAARSDFLMVGALSTLDNTGIYAIVAFMAAAIDIPTKSLYGASIGLVSKHLAASEFEALLVLYRKVAINLLVAGLLLFGCIWVSVDPIFEIIPKGDSMKAGKYVLFFAGLTRLVEMGTGLNNYLVYYSRYYLYSLFSLALMAVLAISLSIWLIPILGIYGAALATLCSSIGYNGFSVLLVWWLFKMQPFTANTLRALGLALVAYGICRLLPDLSVPLFNLALHSGMYAALFGGAVLYFRVSPDLNDTLEMARNKIRKKRGKR